MAAMNGATEQSKKACDADECGEGYGGDLWLKWNHWDIKKGGAGY